VWICCSLNHEKRRRELLRVSRENSAMIKRISDRKPDLSRSSWSTTWSKNLSYLDNISKYDLEWHESKVLSIDFLFLSHSFFVII
jgi:hypothetical protein